MRKTILIFVIIFLLVSILFYAPVRHKIFKQEQAVSHSSLPVSKITAEFIGSVNNQQPVKRLVRCVLADSDVEIKSGSLYSDSSSSYLTTYFKVADRELVFRTQTTLPRGKKTVQFFIKALSDSLQISCQTGTQSQKQDFNGCSGVLKSIIFQIDPKESYQVRLKLKGEALISQPMVQIPESLPADTGKDKVLILDLPADQIRELSAVLDKKQWLADELIPCSYQTETALGAFLYREQPSVQASLPQEYFASAADFNSLAKSDWLKSWQLEQQTLFSGCVDIAAKVAAVGNLFDHSLLFKPKDFSLAEQLYLAKHALAKSVGLFYLYCHDSGEKKSSADNNLIATKLNDLIRQNPGCRIAIISSLVPEFAKSPLLFYNQKKAADPQFATLTDLAAELSYRSSSDQKKRAENSKCLSQIIRDDSLIYLFQNDTISRLSVQGESFKVSRFNSKGSIVEKEAGLSAIIRNAYNRTGSSFLKIITFDNLNSETQSYQLKISSNQNFYVVENNQIKTVNDQLFDLQLSGMSRKTLQIFYTNQEQLFKYSAKQNIRAVYGSISLPLGQIDGFLEKSVLTHYSANPLLRKKSELRIENFAAQPIWRYSQSKLK